MSHIHSLLLVFATFVASYNANSQIEEDTIGRGNYRQVTVSASHEADVQHGINTLSALGLLPNLNAASRFLGQATLGADYETIDSASQMGLSNWLEDQFSRAPSVGIEQYMKDLAAIAYDSVITYGGDSSDFNLRTFHFHFGWWQYIMNSPDLLRARVALALSEVMVVSELSDLGGHPLGLASYYDILVEHAFGNYRDLLEDVSLHPAMGTYLTHLNNPKSDSSENRFPDENYAREVMQLFTIGLYELNQDGSRKLDTNGMFIPTYDHIDIAEFAKIFTGLSWGDATEWGKRNPPTGDSYTLPMAMFDDWHEPGEKHLLNGLHVPDRQPVDGMADVQDAIDNLFNHPNVGPFFGRLLIQRLVKSNPGPEYISRVAAAFNDNGQGVRGDMKSVIRAILLDPEARDCDAIHNPLNGMLREPLIRYTNLTRAFNAASQQGLYRNTMNDFYEIMEQRPLSSPSVFNFFQPDYQPIGPIADTGFVAPVFQITNSSSTVGYGSMLNQWLMRLDDAYLMEYRRIFSGEDYNPDLQKARLDLADEYQLSEAGALGDLIERINLILLHGQMSQQTRDYIRNTIEQVPDEQYELRTRLAIFLCMISPDYLIFR